MASRKVRDLASSAEVAEAISHLSAADSLRLNAIARLRASGLRATDADDLLSEAKAQAIAGTRPWPREVPLVAFLAQAMRSIANGEREGFNERRVTVDPELNNPDADSGSPFSRAASSEAGPERAVLAEKTLDEIYAAFKDDRHAIAVLDGMAEGLSPDEIRGETMTAVEYASAQKRIRRAVLRMYLKKEE